MKVRGWSDCNLPLEWGTHDSQVLDLWLQFSWIGVFCSSSPRIGTKTEKIMARPSPELCCLVMESLGVPQSLFPEEEFSQPGRAFPAQSLWQLTSLGGKGSS